MHQLLGRPSLPNSNFVGDKDFPTPDHIGIEIELENSTSTIRSWDLYHWNIIRDGSLRNVGVEFVFRKPFAGAQITNALNELSTRVSSVNPSRLITSSRTSVHVHMNVLDMSTKELYTLLCLYTMYERVLYQYAGPKRYHNNNCIPVARNDTFISAVSYLYNINKFKVASSTDFYRIVNSCGKYSGLNLRSLIEPTWIGELDYHVPRGSIEYRMHYGSKDMEKVKVWVQLLLALKNSAKGVQDESLLDLSDSLSSVDLTRQIFKDKADLLINTDNFIRNMKKGRADLIYLIKEESRNKVRYALIKKLKKKPKKKKKVNNLCDGLPESAIAIFPVNILRSEEDAITEILTTGDYRPSRYMYPYFHDGVRYYYTEDPKTADILNHIARGHDISNIRAFKASTELSNIPLGRFNVRLLREGRAQPEINSNEDSE